MSSTIWGFVTPSTDSCLSVPVFWGKTRQGDPLRPDDRCRISISFFIAIAVAVHKENLFRTLISGSLIMTMTLWITNQTIPWVTALAKSTGALSGDGLAAAMDQGGEPDHLCIHTVICKRKFKRCGSDRRKSRCL